MQIKLALFGEIVEVEPWDGLANNGAKYPYNLQEKQYMKDSDGNIYDLLKDGRGLWYMWCNAAKLSHHLHRLGQIKARPYIPTKNFLKNF